MSVVQTLIGNVKGPQGATGATGQTGAQGPAATITVGSTTTTAYGNSAQVTNVGTSSAAVLDFVIPQGRPGEATTKMGDLVLDAITTSAADFPSPQVDDTGKVAFGKIVKFFSDVLSRFTKHAGDIATVSASPTTQNFTAGEYLINNDQLYKVTSNISSGGTITPGTNVSSTSVGAQLTSLNDSLVKATSGQDSNSNSYLSVVANYTKIGRMCTVSFEVEVKNQNMVAGTSYTFALSVLPLPERNTGIVFNIASALFSVNWTTTGNVTVRAINNLNDGYSGAAGFVYMTAS